MSRENPDALVQELEQELRQALAIEPSPAFARRVRARIDDRSTGRGWHWPRWPAPLLAAAACLLAIGIGWEVARDSARPAGPTAPRTGTDVALHPSPGRAEVPAMPRPRRPPGIVAPVEPAMRASVSEPEIIVPPDRAQALARLVELTRSGIVNEETLRPVASTVPPEALDVSPLVVSPIAVPEIETGSRTAPSGATRE